MQRRGSLSIAWKSEDQSREQKLATYSHPKQVNMRFTANMYWYSAKTDYIPRQHSPSVVLSVEQEVRTHDGDAHGHDAEDDQDQHHEAVHIVNFIGPKRCEDEVPEERREEKYVTCCKDHLTRHPTHPSVLQHRLTFQWKWTQMEGFPRGRRWRLAPWTWEDTTFNIRIWLWSVHIRFPLWNTHSLC